MKSFLGMIRFMDNERRKKLEVKREQLGLERAYSAYFSALSELFDFFKKEGVSYEVLYPTQLSDLAVECHEYERWLFDRQIWFSVYRYA